MPDGRIPARARARKAFWLTAAGRRALARWRADVAVEQLPELRDPGLLKLFFGADPASLAAARIAAHRRQLEGYEAQLAAMDADAPLGPRLTLEAGMGHEREWVRFWERLARD